MKFTINKKVFDVFPGMKLAVVILRDVNNQLYRSEIQTELKQAWVNAGKAATEYENPQSHPRIKPWIEHFKAIGVSRKQFPSSIESLVRRAGKSSEPVFINPLVDFYNSISLNYIVTAGGYDIDQLENGLELRYSRTGDEFQALDEEDAYQVPEGEISYADGSHILTRHFLWRQSKLGLILPKSEDVMLVSEIPGELGADLCDKVLASLTKGAQKHFDTHPESYIMDVDHHTIEF